MAEETIKEVHLRAETYQRKFEKRYNSRVKPRNIQASDLVWRKCGEARKDAKEDKLAADQECPFRVMERLRNKSYQLEHLSDKAIPRT